MKKNTVYLQLHRCITTQGATLTGLPTVTTPNSFTTLGCLNCPLMAASWRNLTVSASGEPGFSVFNATSIVPIGEYQYPLWTSPNWPDPSAPMTLSKQGRKSEGRKRGGRKGGERRRHEEKREGDKKRENIKTLKGYSGWYQLLI